MRQNQNSKDFLSIFKQYENSLRRFISGFLVNSQDVEDIAQETFLRTYKSNEQEEISKPKSFMFRVAKNLIISEYRRSSFKLTDYIEDVEQDACVSTETLEEEVETEQKLTLFCEGLATLPEQTRKVVIMRKVFGMPIKDISEKTGMPISTVNWNIAKGLVHCDNLLEKQELKRKHDSQKTSREGTSKNDVNSIMEDC